MKKLIFGGLVGTALVNNLCAQDALRESAAGEEAAEARAKANNTIGYYNLRLGDLRLRMESDTTVEGDDNVNLVNTNQVGDVIFQPSVNTQLTYPISQKNSLNLNLTLGYSAYVREPHLDQFFITPGTALAFDTYIKDFIIEVRDSFALTEQSYNNPAAASEADYSYLENVSGITTTWDLDQIQLSGAYDYLIREALNSADAQENSTQHLISLRSGVNLNSVSVFGLEAGAGFTQYEQTTLTGGAQYTIGVFYRLRLSQNFSLRADAGYVIDNLDTPAAASTNYQQNADTYYGSLSIEHRVNKQLAYNLQIGREVDAGLYSDLVDLYYVRLQTDIHVIRQWDLKLNFAYEDGSENGGLGETFDRYGAGANISHPLTQKMILSLNYSFWDRFSDLPDRSYVDDQILLKLTYNF